MKKNKKVDSKFTTDMKLKVFKKYSRPQIIQECIFETRALACANIPTNEDCAGNPKYS